MKLFNYLACFGLLFLCTLKETKAWKLFHHGRQNGGNLGLPGKSSTYLRGEEDNVQTLWYDQKLNHFDPTEKRSWKQRYYINDALVKDPTTAPVFLMIGGEGEATIEWMTRGAWTNYGKKFGALLIQLEHRFYGKSHPTEDLSTENLVYLSSSQALEDLATFISFIKSKYSLTDDNKWIAFGGSYPGSLAAWLRLKYPHLVHGSMSASGPLLAKADFYEYYQVVDDSLATFSDECVTAVKSATKYVELLLKKKLGRKNLDKMFKLCDPVEQLNTNHISNLLETLAGNFAGVVQYNKDYRMSKSATGNVTIDDVCKIMVNEKIGTPVERLATFSNMLLSLSDEPCLDYNYDKMIYEMQNTSWESSVSEGGRQWTYQTCTEFGWYQTSSYTPQVFGDLFPVDFFTQQCSDIFGPEFNNKFIEKAVERSNTVYGAKDIQITNVVFVHGSIDPWHAMGITKTLEQDAPAIYINGTAHCANMYPESENDLPGLKAARVEIENYIDKWLNL